LLPAIVKISKWGSMGMMKLLYTFGKAVFYEIKQTKVVFVAQRGCNGYGVSFNILG
jgi:hypothetical protein